GGDVVLRADRHVDNLTNLFYEPIIKAKSGGRGMGKTMYGRSAHPKIVKVPVGTIVYRADEQKRRTSNVEHRTSIPVILSEVEGSRGADSKLTPRDSSTSLGMTAPVVDLT